MRKNIFRIAVLCLVVCQLTFFAGCRFITKARAIHKAAYKGNLEKVKKIIAKNPAQIDVQDWLGYTPLQLASGKGHTEIVEFLLDHGADIELENVYGKRPLLFAAEYGHYNTVRTLLEHGATVNCKDKFGITPLHEAALWSNEKVINLLISYGADVNAKNDSNDTPLHVAAMRNNIEAAKVRVEHGADIFAKNDYDFSTLDRRTKMDNKKWAEQWANFLTQDTKNKTPKEIALKAGYKELAQYLQAKEDEKKGDRSQMIDLPRVVE